MLNQVTLSGRLTAAPELKTSQSGITFCQFCIAVDRDFVAQGQQRETDFIWVDTFRQTAEFVGKYFTKGQQIILTGRLQVRRYKAQDGSDRQSTSVVADHVWFAGSKAQNDAVSAPADNGVYSNGYSAKPSQGNSGASQTQMQFTPVDDDDLPF